MRKDYCLEILKQHLQYIHQLESDVQLFGHSFGLPKHIYPKHIFRVMPK